MECIEKNSNVEIRGQVKLCEDSDDDSEDQADRIASGFCHFNVTGEETTFNIKLFGKDLSIRQDPKSREFGHGAVVWDASIIFTKYMENNPKLFCGDAISGKRVIELGSGCGLGGLAFMLRGAAVTVTDLAPVVTHLTSVNVKQIYRQMLTEFSSVTLIEPRVQPLDWTSFDASAYPCIPYDTVLLTDCVFSASLVPDLVSVIRQLSGPKTEILCCHEIRDEEANQAFLSEMDVYFKLKRIPWSKLHQHYRNDLVEIIVAKMRPSSRK